MVDFNYNLSSLEEYKFRLIQEDDSVLGREGISNIVGEKKLDELSEDELKYLLQNVRVKLYSSKNAEILDQKGLLNQGICPQCGKNISNEKYWKYPESSVLLYMCDECWIEEQKDLLNFVNRDHPKYYRYKRNIRTSRSKSGIKFLYRTTQPLIFGFLIITLIQLFRAIFGNVKWSSVGYFFICFIGIALINYLLSFGVKDKDL